MLISQFNSIDEFIDELKEDEVLMSRRGPVRATIVGKPHGELPLVRLTVRAAYPTEIGLTQLDIDCGSEMPGIPSEAQSNGARAKAMEYVTTLREMIEEATGDAPAAGFYRYEPTPK